MTLGELRKVIGENTNYIVYWEKSETEISGRGAETIPNVLDNENVSCIWVNDGYVLEIELVGECNA